MNINFEYDNDHGQRAIDIEFDLAEAWANGFEHLGELFEDLGKAICPGEDISCESAIAFMKKSYKKKTGKAWIDICNQGFIIGPSDLLRSR